ncbi:hypothetical protein [Halosimplex sp. TS25]|uniref:hypothetical protein n=1 Tax=Halosimplex rarum TaxID=3396619 RepID=UPI0039ED3AB8
MPATAVCRARGFDTRPAPNRRGRFVWGVLGALLVLSVVGAPLGAALCWKAIRHHRAMSGGVVADAGRPAPLSAALDTARVDGDTAPGRGEGEP